MPPRRARLSLAALVAGAVLAVAGAALVVTASATAVGWFAYAPLSGTAFTPGTTLVGPQHLWGAGITVVGLVVAAWAAGYRTGRRAPR